MDNATCKGCTRPNPGARSGFASYRAELRLIATTTPVEALPPRNCRSLTSRMLIHGVMEHFRMRRTPDSRAQSRDAPSFERRARREQVPRWSQALTFPAGLPSVHVSNAVVISVGKVAVAVGAQASNPTRVRPSGLTYRGRCFVPKAKIAQRSKGRKNYKGVRGRSRLRTPSLPAS